MNEKIKTAIEVLAARIDASTQPNEALHLSQAALNLAHTALVLKDV